MPKKTTSLVSAKNAVRGSFNTPRAPYLEQNHRYGAPKRSKPDILMQGLRSLSGDSAVEFVEWLSGFPSTNISLFSKKPITDPSKIAFGEIETRMPLFARIYFLILLMGNTRERLSNFVALKMELERCIISEKFDEANSVLNSIEEQYGLSLWGIELRIALLQSWKGLEAQKEYVAGVKERAKGKAASVVSFWVSQRNEEGTIYARFISRIRSNMGKWKTSRVVTASYSYILGVDNLNSFDDGMASSVVASVASVSMIDAYCVLKDALCALIERGQPIPPELIEAFALASPTNDPFAAKLKALGSGELNDLRRANTALIDGSFEMGPARSLHEAPPKPEQSDALIDRAYAAATLRTRRDQPGRRMLQDELERLATLSIARSTGFAQGVDIGLKRLANFKGTDFARAIDGFVRLHDGGVSVFGQSPATPLFLYSEQLHPWQAAVVPQSLSEAILSQFPESLLASTIQQALLDVLPPDAVPLSREFAARRELGSDRPAKALIALGQIPASTFADRRLTPLKVTALLKSGNLGEALRAAADLCVRDPELISKLPLDAMIDEIRSVKFNVPDKLSLTIILHAYLSNREDGQIFQKLQFAFEDTLSNLGVERPSLISEADYTSDPRIIFLMKHIAVPSVMDVSFWLYKTSRDTLSERLSICSVLLTADADDITVHQDEIKEITRIIDIEDGLEDVDRSRVFVDRSRLERWANQEIRESFERYKALTSVGIGFDDPVEFEKTIKDFLAGKDISSTGAAQFPRDEAGQLLIEMFDLVVDKYFNDEDFGLDAYLSMRVRHGSLAGHLRGALEETGILVARDKATGKFPVPPEWADLSDEIVKFSTEYDLALGELTKNKLQINSIEHGEGLFHFEMQPLSIYYVRAGIDESSTLDEFLSKIYDVLDVFLARSLQQVRGFITVDFRERVELALSELSQAQGLPVASPRRAELQNTIAEASPDWQASIDRVASWFAPNEDNEKAALRTMQQIVEIAVQATRNAHRGFDPILDLDIEDFGSQSADVLIAFTDLLFTILDNVHRHCGIEGRPKVSISVKETEFELPNVSHVLLRVCNDVDDSARTSAAQKRIQKIKGQIASGDYKSRVKREGGTGFLKLKRIIAPDPRQTLDFDFTDDGFCVSVGLVVVYYSPGEIAVAP